MSYAEEEDVVLLVGLANCTEIDEAFLRMADTFVESILGRTFGAEKEQIDTFDLVERSVYLENDVGSREYPLTFWPVSTVSKVVLQGWNNGVPPISPSETELVENSDYWVNTGEQGTVIVISNDVYLAGGAKKIRVEYTYGYEEVPQDVKDFASYICAANYDGSRSIATNADGVPLEELEIGRYREKYAMGREKIYASKYGNMIKMMEGPLVEKYKLWR